MIRFLALPAALTSSEPGASPEIATDNSSPATVPAPSLIIAADGVREEMGTEAVCSRTDKNLLIKMKSLGSLHQPRRPLGGTYGDSVSERGAFSTRARIEPRHPPGGGEWGLADRRSQSKEASDHFQSPVPLSSSVPNLSRIHVLLRRLREWMVRGPLGRPVKWFSSGFRAMLPGEGFTDTDTRPIKNESLEGPGGLHFVKPSQVTAAQGGVGAADLVQ